MFNYNNRNAGMTKTKIYKAFIDIAENNNFAKSTIKKITEKAKISRSIFYYYYTDKDDLARQLFHKFVRNQAKILSSDMKKETMNSITKTWSIFFNNLNIYRREYKAFDNISKGYQDTIFSFINLEMCTKEFLEECIDENTECSDSVRQILIEIAMSYYRHILSSPSHLTPIEYITEIYNITGEFLRNYD